ncbi:hypothetical protein DICPUDRAFT_39928 [Dictyostelium purpureum]|uniref:Pleckstrin domain-containing protein n=1 Tax=Dictyostelium purpureum TaxID=5786 RepID=F0ZX88_DICPU|nr:uncharacterized protein DICPUDRAFT_39928 [Dictyostelium purpureum]EGC31432.1 hypothetical protein DICPUDRAFT_39928 [Dictyostelium purpureum]|eukprot:XP_003292031.1 hypothetical protein DICPUDRAFT_39928 [Dictyostelium purpureum]
MEKIRNTVERLSSIDVSIQENCLRILINISTDDQYHKIILDLVGIKKFKELLQSHNEVIQMLSTWLLSHLSFRFENSEVILKSDLIPVIKKLLLSENEDIVEKALWLMRNLTINGNHSHLLIEYGIVDSLVDFLDKSNYHLIILASEPLRNLLHKDTCGEYLDNQKVFCHKKSTDKIKKLLTSGYPTNQLIMSLITLIHVLSIYHPLIRRIVAVSGVLNQLISYLSSPSAPLEIKKKVIIILINLSLTEETERAILSVGAIMPLVDIVVSISSSVELKSLCVSCLANLTSNPDIRRVLRSNYLIDGLSELLKEKSSHTSQLLESISLLIANLCIDEICRFKISQSDCDRALSELIDYPHLQVRERITNALENIRVPISFETLNELADIEDMSDLEDPSGSLSGFSSSSSPFGGFSSSPLNQKGSILRISRSISPVNNLLFNNNNNNNNISNSNSNSSNNLMASPTSFSPKSPTPITQSPSNSNTQLQQQSLPQSPLSLQSSQQQQQSLPQSPIRSPEQSQQQLQPPSEILTINSMIPPPMQDDPNKIFRRGRIIKEIIDTEQAYVHALSVCIRVYYNPLVVSPTVPPILPLDLVEVIYSNIDKVFRINCEFLKKLRGMSDKKDVLELAQALQWYWDQPSTIPEYRTYINGFNRAMDTVHENRAKLPKFKEFLEKCQFSEQCKSETIDSYLIRPVQRIPRYILLLSDLLVHTVDMLERNAIEEVLRRTKLITDQLNESKRKAENLAKTVLLQEKVVGLTEILISGYSNKDINGGGGGSNHGSSNSLLSNSKDNNTSTYGSASNGNGSGGSSLTSSTNSNYGSSGGGVSNNNNNHYHNHNNNHNNHHSISLTTGLNNNNGNVNNNNNNINNNFLLNSNNLIPASRYLVKDGLMMESRQKKVSKYRYLILFSDILFITKQKKNKYTLFKTVPLIDLKILEMPQPQNETGFYSFQILWSGHNDKKENGMVIYTSNLEEKEEWVKTLKDACNFIKKSHLTNIMRTHLTIN